MCPDLELDDHVGRTTPEGEAHGPPKQLRSGNREALPHARATLGALAAAVVKHAATDIDLDRHVGRQLSRHRRVPRGRGDDGRTDTRERCTLPGPDAVDEGSR